MSTDDDIPMPYGNGDSDCPKCRGRGVISIDLDGWPGAGTQNCDCVFRRDLTANVKRIWPVLLTVDSVDDSPLLAHANRSLWITASNYALRRHLRYVAFRMGTTWDAKVIADATLMTAWLSTAKNVRDPDVLIERSEGRRSNPSDDFMTLVDLAAPFDLLIIRLGVKAAANKEMANVLAEAIQERELLGKPTWVADSPGHPLVPGHRCYSDEVVELLDGFKRLVLQEDAPKTDLDQAKYAVKSVAKVAAGAPVPTQAMGVGLYPPKKATFQELLMTPPAGPARSPKPVIPPDDDDEFSVDSLASAAVDPRPTPPGEDDEADMPEGSFDLQGAMTNYPTTEEMVTNGRPKWLEGRLQKSEKGGSDA